MARVLVADDNKEVVFILTQWLKLEDKMTVDAASNGGEALEFLRTYEYDVVVLDWEMPQMSGVEVCREYRLSNRTTPVILLTGRDSIDDKVIGLDSGADDYVTKPFSAEELSARIRALMRRKATRVVPRLQSGEVIIEPESRNATAAGMALMLSPTEFDLLAFFVEHQGEVFSPEALLQRVWGDSDTSSVAGVRTAIKKLRRKLEDTLSSCPLNTVRGVGYSWPKE